MYWEGYPDKLSSNATKNKIQFSLSKSPIYVLAVSHFGFPKIILYIYCSLRPPYDSRKLYTMTTSGGPCYDLNPVESFCSLFKYLWLPPDQL